MNASSWARLVGFLAARRAYIYAQIQRTDLDEWQTRYFLATGELLSPAEPDAETGREHGRGYEVVDRASDNKWGSSLQLSVTATVDELIGASAFSALPLSTNIAERKKGRVEITDGVVIWKLFDWGFVLGGDQTIECVRELVADEHLAEFDEGVRIGLSKKR